MTVKSLTKDMLANYLDSTDSIVFIDFWAEWCGPCKGFAKVFEDVASNYNQVEFVSLDIDKQPELADTFSIRSVPHLLVLKDGVVIYSDSGSMSKSSLVELVEQALVAKVEAD